MLWALPLVICVLATAYFLRNRPAIHRNGERLRRPPDTLPILGNALRFLQARQVLFDWFVQCQRRFGNETVEISVPTLPPGVLIHAPANVEFVLRNEAAITKGDFFKSRSWDLFGYGIINANGELWKAQRKAGLKFFSGTNLDILIEDVLPEVYQKSREVLLQHAKDGTPFDLQRIFLDLTTRVMGIMAYDMDMDATSPFSQAFEYASDQIGLRFQNPLYHLTELVTGSRFRTALAEVNRFGVRIVQTAHKKRSRTAFKSLFTENPPEFDTLIDSLIETFPNAEKVVSDAALNFLSAGRDTTAQSLTWTFYHLMRHPQTTTFIQPELDALQSIHHRSPKSSSKMTVADLQSTRIPRITAVYYESLRLHPPVPFELKQVQSPVTLPDGTCLPATAIVVWCVWAMNRSLSVFGSDADSFRPGRWIDKSSSDDGDDRSSEKFIPKTAFEFPVFNGGPRACLGKKMAELMATYLIARLVGEFIFEEVKGLGVDEAGPPGEDERVSQNSLTLPMRGGLPCRVWVRGEPGGRGGRGERGGESMNE